MQKDNPFFTDLSRFASSAAGAAMDMGRELEQSFQEQMRQMVERMQLVSREEFEVVKQMAEALRLENDALKARIEALEKPKAAKSTAKKTAKK